MRLLTKVPSPVSFVLVGHLTQLHSLNYQMVFTRGFNTECKIYFDRKLRYMGTHPFFAIFTKGDNFCDFLVGFLGKKL